MAKNNRAWTLLQSYNYNVTFGEKDHEEAIQSAIDSLFSGYSKEFRADLYASIVEGWPSYRVGIERMVWLEETIKNAKMHEVFRVSAPTKKESKK